MGLLRKVLGRGYRLARRTARAAVSRMVPIFVPSGASTFVTVEEDRFLHSLLSRDRGYARARGQVPSSMVSALEEKRLVTWERAGDGFAIAMTSLGFKIAQRRREQI